MLDKLIENKQLVLGITLVLLLISIILIARSVDVLGFDFSSHKVVELNSTENTRDELQLVVDELSSENEIISLEDGKYRILLEESVSDIDINNKFEPVLENSQEENTDESSEDEIVVESEVDNESQNEIQIFLAEPVISYALVYNLSGLFFGSFVILFIFSFFYDSDLKRYEKFSLIIILYLRTLFEVVLFSGITVLIAFTGIIEINNWVVELVIALGLLSFILKVIEFIYFSSFAKIFEGHDTIAEYYDYVKSFTKYFMILLIIFGILSLGLYGTFDIPYVVGILIIFVSLLIIYFSFAFLGYILIEFIFSALKDVQFIKKNRFLRK